MRRVCCNISLALTVILLLAGCDGSKGSATEEAAQQFAELREEIGQLALSDWMAEASPEELEEVVQKFIETADPTYASPIGKYSILHLACMLKKPELARCLLLDGAEVNTPTMVEGNAAETPLLLAIATDYAPQATAEQINELIDVLVAGGASLTTPGSAETSLTYNTCLTCAHEAVYAHLLDIGAPRSGNELLETAYRGWLGTLTRLLNEQGGLQEAHYPLLTAIARLSGGYYEGDHLACAHYLLEQGVPVDTTDELGRTALFTLASTLPTLQSETQLSTAIQLADLLISRGADPYHRADNDPEYPGFCPYDLLSAHDSVMEALRAAGHELSAPGISIRSGTHLAADVCRTAMMHPTPDTIRPYTELIARLLYPDEQLTQQEIYPDALKNAIFLLCQVDAAKTTQLIKNMPLWKKPAESPPHLITTLVYALQDNSAIVLPANLLLSTAEALLTGGDHENAAALIELMGRAAENDELIARLCNDARPPVQAGAWGAKLLRANLPTACNGSVTAWLTANHREADTPFLRKAQLLTSIEDLWYGNMEKARIDEFIALVKEIGAPKAAAAYRAIADNLSSPENLDELMSTQDSWAYELETATARFLLEHKNEFLPQQPSAH